MRAWLRRGIYAAQLAGDRADLWPAGALAWLAYLGWVPLLLVVAEPDPVDLQALGVRLYGSGAFPANVIALAGIAVGLVVLLALVAAVAELALQRAAAARRPPEPVSGPVLNGMAVLLVAMLPAAAALTVLGTGVAAVARDVYTSPDLETPVLLRLATAIWPLLLVLLAGLVISQAWGAVAFRRATATSPQTVPPALRQAAMDLVRRPVARLGTAAVGTLADAAVLLLTFALLRVLWVPIGTDLSSGRLVGPDTLLLLVGFVAIWLVLLLAGGAVHVATSAWWALELAYRAPRRSGAEAADQRIQGPT